MTPPPVCPYRDPVTGDVCGYQGHGETPKKALEDLFRHQQGHVEAIKTGDRVVVIQPEFAIKVQL